MVASSEVRGYRIAEAGRRATACSFCPLLVGVEHPSPPVAFETFDRICKLFGWPQTFVTNAARADD
jgi:hypothetical protein